MPQRGSAQGIPAPIGVKDPAVVRILEAIRENLAQQESVTQRVNRLNRIIGATDEAIRGLIEGYRPGPVAGLTASGIFGAVLLEAPGLPAQASYLEWLASDTDDAGTATVVGASFVPLFSHNLTDPAGRYYWVRAVGAGNPGKRGPINQTAGTYAKPAPDPEFLLDQISERIKQSDLDQALQQEIGKITGDGPESVNARIAAEAQARADAIQAAEDIAADNLATTASQINQRIEFTRSNLDTAVGEARDHADDVRRDLSSIDLVSSPGQTLSLATQALVRENEIRVDLDAEVSRLDGRADIIRGDLQQSADALTRRADELRSDLDNSVVAIDGHITSLTTGLSQEAQDRIAADNTAAAERQAETETRIGEDDALARTLTLMFAKGGGTNTVYRRADQIPAMPPANAYRVDRGRLEQYIGGAWADAEGFDFDSTRAYVATESQASQDRDSAIASDVDVLRADLTSAQTDITAGSEARGVLETRVQQNETDITTTGANLQELRSDLTDVDSARQANADAITGLTTRVSTNETTLGAQAKDITALETGLASAQGDIEAGTSARQALTTRTTQNEQAISTQGEQITGLQSGLSDANSGIDANAQATGALTTRVTANEGAIDSQSQRLTGLESGVSDLENGQSGQAAAIDGLTTRVTTNESALTAQAEELTALQSSLQDTDADLAAETAAREQLATRTTQNEGNISTQGQSITDLQSALDIAEQDIDANVGATNALTTRVSTNEGAIEAQSGDLVSLRADLDTVEGTQSAQGAAIGNLETTVSQHGDSITSQSQSLTALSATVDQLRESGAENLLGADADDEAADKSVRVDLASANLEPGDIVSVYGEFERASGNRVDFRLAALDGTDAEIAGETKGNVGGTTYEAAKIQAFTIPTGAVALTLYSIAVSGTHTARHFSLNSGPLAAVFYAPSATAEAVGDLKARVEVNEGSITTVSQDITALGSRISDAEQGIDANSGALTLLETRTSDTEQGLSTQAGQLTTLQSELEAAQGDITGNATAIGTLNTGVSNLGDTQTAQASRLDAIETGLDEATGDISGQATAISGLTARVDSNEGGISSLVVRADDIETRITDAESGISGNSAALAALDTRTEKTEQGLSTQAGQITALESGLADTQAGVSGNAEAIGDMTTRVDQTEAGIASQAQDLTALRSDVTDAQSIDLVLAPGQEPSPATKNVLNAQAITRTNTRVDSNEQGLSALSEEVTDLSAGLDSAEQSIAANSQATDALTTEVQANTQGRAAQAQQITDLETGLSDAEAGIEANADATTGLTTRVEQTEAGVTSNSQSITDLSNRADTADSERQATSSALAGLTSDVETLDGQMTAQGEDITSLQARVQAFKLGAEYGFETGVAGAVRVPDGWRLDGDPVVKTYYSAMVDPASAYGSALSYGHDGSGPAPGAWAITKQFSVRDGGGQFKADIKTRVISGHAYALLTCLGADGATLAQMDSGEVVTGYDGTLSLSETLPAATRYVELSLRASALIAA